MRKLYSFSLGFLFATLAFADKPLHPAISLNAARGFQKGKCYLEIASIDCRGKDICSLLVFPKMHGQLSFILHSAPKQVHSTNEEYLQVFFRLDAKSDIRARLLEYKSVPDSEAEAKLSHSDYLGHPVSCAR